MKARNLFPIVFFGLLVTTIIIDLSVGGWLGRIFLFFVDILLMLYFYVVFFKKIKEEGLYLNNSVMQNFIIAFSGTGLAVIMISVLLRTMHWPYGGPLAVLAMIICAVTAVLTAIDVFINFKKIQTTYGYQYLIMLLPSIMYFQFNMASLRNLDLGRSMEKVKIMDDHTGYYAQEIFINNKKMIDTYNSSDQSLKEIHEQASKVRDYIIYLRAELISMTGGVNEGVNGDRNYKGRFEKTQIEVMMNGPMPGKGNAYRLQEKINYYYKSLNALLPDTLSKLKDFALNAKDDPACLNPENKKKDFAELYFAQTNLMEALAFLSQFDLQIVMAEQQFINTYLGSKKK